MSATLVVRHRVDDYTAWRSVYDGLDDLRSQHGCTDDRVLQLGSDGNDVLVTHDFPSAEQAAAFASDPALGEGMARAGVSGAPQVEIFSVA